jgi:methionyl-tRNA synthetase
MKARASQQDKDLPSSSNNSCLDSSAVHGDDDCSGNSVTDELFLSLLDEEEEEMDSYYAQETFDELLQAELEQEIQTAIDRQLEAQFKAFYKNEDDDDYFDRGKDEEIAVSPEDSVRSSFDSEMRSSGYKASVETIRTAMQLAIENYEYNTHHNHRESGTGKESI